MQINILRKSSFFVNYYCQQAAVGTIKSPEAALADYQNRTPDQLLKLIALHNIKYLEPGEYIKGNDWETVEKSKEGKAEWFGYSMGVTLMAIGTNLSGRMSGLLKFPKF